jgi:hypothetical protein
LNGLGLDKIEYIIKGIVGSLSNNTDWTKEHIKARTSSIIDIIDEFFKFQNE